LYAVLSLKSGVVPDCRCGPRELHFAPAISTAKKYSSHAKLFWVQVERSSFKSGISFRFSLYVSAAVAKHFAWLATLNIAQAAAAAGAWLIPEDDLVGRFRLAHVRIMFYAVTWRLTPCFPLR
jgi:hypothetical protein